MHEPLFDQGDEPTDVETDGILAQLARPAPVDITATEPLSAELLERAAAKALAVGYQPSEPPITHPAQVADNGDYVKLRPEWAGQPGVSSLLDPVVVEAIAAGVLLPRGRAERSLTAADITSRDQLAASASIPAELGGLPEDAPEAERYRVNRQDRRRLAKRAGRRTGGTR